MIQVALPGIDTFLEEVLVKENLSEKGEKIRLNFVDILDKLGSRGGEIFTSLNNEQEPSETQEQTPEARTGRSEDDLQGYTEHSTVQAHWAKKSAVTQEKVFICLNVFQRCLFLSYNKA